MIARTVWICSTIALFAFVPFHVDTARASDHDDTQVLKDISRHDARITDLHVFVRGDRLVLAVSTNPTIPKTATAYAFPPDLTLRIHIDNNSPVSFDNPEDLRIYGGTVVSPDRIEEDIVFEVTFERSGRAAYDVRGLPSSAKKQISFFAGLRDDPFIRGPRIGRNVASIVFELPLALVLAQQPTLLVWASSKVPEVTGVYADLGGRSLRSQFSENLGLNTLHPRKHLQELGLPPDVVIFDTSRPCAFPNGRELADDVVDLVGDLRVLSNDSPFPSANDVPFLLEFPYLAPPHLP